MRFWRRRHATIRSSAASSSSWSPTTSKARSPTAERARFEAHLAECDGCTGYLEDMRRLVNSCTRHPSPPLTRRPGGTAGRVPRPALTPYAPSPQPRNNRFGQGLTPDGRPTQKEGARDYWGRIFASSYDDIMDRTEKDVLEIGRGTGANLPCYGERVTSLTITEPEPPMARRLERRLHEQGSRASLIQAPAEVLPFADDSFDTVVSTLVSAPSQTSSER